MDKTYFQRFFALEGGMATSIYVPLPVGWMVKNEEKFA